MNYQVMIPRLSVLWAVLNGISVNWMRIGSVKHTWSLTFENFLSVSLICIFKYFSTKEKLLTYVKCINLSIHVGNCNKLEDFLENIYGIEGRESVVFDLIHKKLQNVRNILQHSTSAMIRWFNKISRVNIKKFVLENLKIAWKPPTNTL